MIECTTRGMTIDDIRKKKFFKTEIALRFYFMECIMTI